MTPVNHRTDLLVVVFHSEDGAEHALRTHWHMRRHHVLSLSSGCVVRRDGSDDLTYAAIRDITPRTVDYYGGVIGYTLACLLFVPLMIGGDDLRARSFAPGVGEGCRSALRPALPPESSAVVFLVRPGELAEATIEAERLGGTVTLAELDTPRRGPFCRGDRPSTGPVRRQSMTPVGVEHRGLAEAVRPSRTLTRDRCTAAVAARSDLVSQHSGGPGMGVST